MKVASSSIEFWVVCILLLVQCLASSAIRIVYIDERASTHVPGRICGTEDSPCASLTAAFGRSGTIASVDYEVRIRPGVYRTSENVGFTFTGSFVSLKKWPPEEASDQRVVFDCEHAPASFAFKGCYSSSLMGVELRNCPTVLVAGSTDFTVADSHFVDGKPAAAAVGPSILAGTAGRAQSAAATTGGALMIIHTKGLVVRDSEFANYTARAGGALFVDSSEGLRLERLRIRDMVAHGGGGGIHLTSCDGPIRIKEVRLTNCSSRAGGGSTSRRAAAGAGGGGGLFVGSCKGKTTLSDATFTACTSGGAEGGAIQVVASEVVAQRVALTPNKRTNVRCEGQASVIDVDGTLVLPKECTDPESGRHYSERDTRLSSAPQNVAHAAVVLVMFILGLNWILGGLEAGAFL